MRADFLAGGQFMRGGEQSTDDLYHLVSKQMHISFMRSHFFKKKITSYIENNINIFISK